MEKARRKGSKKSRGKLPREIFNYSQFIRVSSADNGQKTSEEEMKFFWWITQITRDVFAVRLFSPSSGSNAANTNSDLWNATLFVKLGVDLFIWTKLNAY